MGSVPQHGAVAGVGREVETEKGEFQTLQVFVMGDDVQWCRVCPSQSGAWRPAAACDGKVEPGNVYRARWLGPIQNGSGTQRLTAVRESGTQRRDSVQRCSAGRGTGSAAGHFQTLKEKH